MSARYIRSFQNTRAPLSTILGKPRRWESGTRPSSEPSTILRWIVYRVSMNRGRSRSLVGLCRIPYSFDFEETHMALSVPGKHRAGRLTHHSRSRPFGCLAGLFWRGSASQRRKWRIAARFQKVPSFICPPFFFSGDARVDVHRYTDRRIIARDA